MNEELIKKYLEGTVIIENDRRNRALLIDLYKELKRRRIFQGSLPEGSATYYVWNLRNKDWEAFDYLDNASKNRKDAETVPIATFYEEVEVSFNNYPIF